ncbi:MAG: type II toxin-antitoxin system RelE/ParE family toxin [Acidobacteria bacterium]|nr:type II toxin-antitoxin system RelE/ParE family toxin [Acidobacteriota bacterium]
MESFPIQLEIYRRANGKRPFVDWVTNLDPASEAAIVRRLDRVRSGNLGDYKSVGKGVFELRVNWGPGYRVYFGRDGGRLVIVLAGGDKSSQSSDITLAQRYWMEYGNHRTL